MHATMMNFYPFTCQSLMLPNTDTLPSYSPAGTPSPPATMGYLPSDLIRRPAFIPLSYQPHHQLKNYSVPSDTSVRSIRPKGSFTIEAILGLNSDENKDFVGAIRYSRRERVMPYSVPVPSATPRSSLTALLPSSPESSPKKDENKCRSRHLVSSTDESDGECVYNPLLAANPSTRAHPTAATKSPPHGGGKMKRIRTIFTPEQLERLESEFERQQYMVGPERQYLASTLSLSESQVKIWFQNRRIKWRKQHLEIQQARLAQLRDTEQQPRVHSENDADLQQSSSPGPSWEDALEENN